MISIKRLFKESSGDEIEELLSVVPLMNPPEFNSKVFHDDIETVIFYINNPSLDQRFLSVSHDSVDEIFKSFCEECNIDVDLKSLKKPLKKLKKVSKYLKNKYKRPRPKNNLLDMSDSYDKIDDMSSYSFPSGHTSRAYFISSYLSNLYPEFQADFETIASLIGQSRIENGVHYPTDVTYGRLVGESLSDYLINKEKNTQERSKSNNKDFAMHLRELNSNPRKTAVDLANFLYRTLQIEQLDNFVSFSECFEAAKNLLTSLSDERLSKNPYINSQCKALRQSYCNKQNSEDLIVDIHKQFSDIDLESGRPGEFRSHEHQSPTGVKYCSPSNFRKTMKKMNNIDNPFVKHAVFEWIHPFSDGNGRAGRIMLCKDCDYNFEKVLNFISNDYFKKLDNFYCNSKIEDVILS